MNGIWVKLSNIGGTLSNEWFKTIEEAQHYVATELAPLLSDGDTLRIEEGWSEQGK